MKETFLTEKEMICSADYALMNEEIDIDTYVSFIALIRATFLDKLQSEGGSE